MLPPKRFYGEMLGCDGFASLIPETESGLVNSKILLIFTAINVSQLRSKHKAKPLLLKEDLKPCWNLSIHVGFEPSTRTSSTQNHPASRIIPPTPSFLLE
jgi:hypothetical protein